MHITRANLQQPDPCVPASAFNLAHWICFGLCVFLAGWMVGETIFSTVSDRGSRAALTLVIAATVSTLVSLSRTLPLQNVLLAGTVIGLIGGFVQTVGTLTGMPSGPFHYATAAGPRCFGILPWWIPLIWIIAVLNSRGAIKLVLRPWRKKQNYGFRLLGLTVALCLVFDLGLELFATAIKGYWVWGPPRLFPVWQAIPLSHFLIQAVSLLAILVVVTPLLINKKPVELPPDYHPLLLWTLLNLVFLAGAITEHLWLAAALVSGATLSTGFFALRGAKR